MPFLSVDPVLESNQADYYTNYNSRRVWRRPVGLCDVWLHTLLSASWAAVIWSRKTPQGAYSISIDAYQTAASHWPYAYNFLVSAACTSEIPSEPSLQNPKQGVRNNIDAVGSCVWYIALDENHWQEELLTCAAFCKKARNGGKDSMYYVLHVHLLKPNPVQVF